MNKSTKIPISSFILIGGQSKRFGYPKWQSKIGETTLLNHIYNKCSLFNDISIVGKLAVLNTQLTRCFFESRLNRYINDP